MKKKIYLVLCVTLTMMILCACNKNKSKEDVTQESEPIQEEYEVTTVDVDANQYMKGSVDGSRYTSEWLNLEFDSPQNAKLRVMTSDELNGTKDMLADNYSKEMLDKAIGSVDCEMNCESEDGLAKVSVIVEHLGNKVSANDYLTTLKANLTAVSGADIEYKFDETVDTVSFAGDDYSRISTTVTSGKKSLIQEYYVKSKDNDIVSIIFTYADNDDGKKSFKQLYDSFIKQ